MIGAILCGGYGKRLKPITDQIPKPLIEIKDGYTILDNQITQFQYAGIKKVYLLTGYMHELIKERYGAEWNGVKIGYVHEDKQGGTLYAMNLLFKKAKEDVILRNGDIVSDINLKQMLDSHSNRMTMFITPLISPYGITEIANGKIVDFREKPALNYYINAGIYIIDKKIFGAFKKHAEGDVEKLVFPEIAKSGLLNYYKEDGVFWQSVDSPKDLESVRNEYKNKTDKPWGYEKIIVHTDKYLTKELYLMKGEGTSVHYHTKKDETMHVTRGECIIYFEDREVHLKANETVRIEPNVRHRIFAVENTVLQEYSTPHIDDTVRVKDDYKR